MQRVNLRETRRLQELVEALDQSDSPKFKCDRIQKETVLAFMNDSQDAADHVCETVPEVDNERRGVRSVFQRAKEAVLRRFYELSVICKKLDSG